MSEGVNAVAVSIAVSPTTETTTTAAEATTKTVRASSTTKTTMRTTLENRDEPESQQAHSPPPPHAHTKPHVKKHRKYCISNKTFLWIDGRKIRSALKKSQQRPRKVSFPSDDTELVTGYLEPANPWEHGKSTYLYHDCLFINFFFFNRFRHYPRNSFFFHENNSLCSSITSKSLRSLRVIYESPADLYDRIRTIVSFPGKIRRIIKHELLNPSLFPDINYLRFLHCHHFGVLYWLSLYGVCRDIFIFLALRKD